MKLAELNEQLGLTLRAQTETLNALIGVKSLPPMGSLELFTLRSRLRAVAELAQELQERLNYMDM